MRTDSHRIAKGLTALACALLVTGAASAMTETLYLTDSGDEGQNTRLFKVHPSPTVIQSPTPPQGTAELELLLEITDPGYDNVDALACDGGACWLIDKLSFNVGRYDIATGDFQTMASLTHDGASLEGVVLAGFSPDGTLYIASQATERLYILPDPSTGVAMEVGPVEVGGQPLDITGADLAFAANGQLYLWTNGTGNLYELLLPAVYPGTVIGTFIVEHGTPHFMTGLAVRANGYGDLFGSVAMQDPNINDHFHQIQRDGVGEPPFNSPVYPAYAMYYNGAPYDYSFGDMSSGSFDLCNRTIGYYKNHDWNGEVVSVCGTVFDQNDGQTVLWNATNVDFSMLVAQLIAAKLNVDSATGVPQIEAAEDFLCSPAMQDYLHDFDPNWWAAPHQSKQLKRQSVMLKNALDQFNNTNDCEDDDPRLGGGRR